MRIDEELFVALLDDISNHGLIGSDSIKAEAEVDVRMLDKDQQSDIELAIKECLEEFSYALAISTLGAQKVASRSAAPNY